jgi:hypothetical protein
MFDSTKTANFQATVTIHELVNVPQLAGNFAVSWKFRGKKPRSKESCEQTSLYLLRPESQADRQQPQWEDYLRNRLCPT